MYIFELRVVVTGTQNLDSLFPQSFFFTLTLSQKTNMFSYPEIKAYSTEKICDFLEF